MGKIKKADNSHLKAEVDYKLESPGNPVVTGIQFQRALDSEDKEKIIVRISVKDINNGGTTW